MQNTVQSLLENAVLYNEKAEKEVRIKLIEEDSSVKLSVSDNGPGISEVDRIKIFEKFYRTKTSRKIPGTGLGLYLAKHIVESHNGSLVLSASQSGTGSQFDLRLPKLEAKSG